MGTLNPSHKPDYSNTQPPFDIPPNPAWADPAQIVSLDPWGHLIPSVFAKEIEAGLDVRPSIAVDGGAMRSEDDLTYKLGDIIKASANVRRCEQEGAPAHVITEFEQLLQVCDTALTSHPSTYMGRLASSMWRHIWITTSPVSHRLCRSRAGP